MSAKYKEQWKPRMIRMPDELWQEVVEQAKLQDICAAEFVRLLLQKELDISDGEVIYRGEVIGVYTRGAKKSKSVYTSSPISHPTSKILYTRQSEVKVSMPGNYSCGCKRGSTKLCPKHHRI